MRIDCNITENFLREQERMVQHETGWAMRSEPTIGERIAMVQKWSDEHQQKTLLEDFYEKFPDAPRGSDGYPRTCAEYIYNISDSKYCPEGADCSKCWDKILKE